MSFDASYNPFGNKPLSPNPAFRHDPSQERPSAQGDWRILYGDRVDQTENREFPSETVGQKGNVQFIQLDASYIITTMKSGILVIDQQLAHQRVLFERFLNQIENQTMHAQQELFPQHISLNINDASLLKEMMPDLENLGFQLEMANATTFVIKGTPADSAGIDAVGLVEKMLENYKQHRSDLQLERKLNLAHTMAVQLAVKTQTNLTDVEMQNIVDQLFACNMPDTAPDGRKVFFIVSVDEMKTRFSQ